MSDTEKLERLKARLASLEREFQGWQVAVVEMAELRNSIRKLERKMAPVSPIPMTAEVR